MSKFFRSADSSSSSDTEPDSNSDGDVEDDAADLSEPSLDLNVAGQSNTVDHVQLQSNRSVDHRDLLLHALLEERCMNETLAAYSDGRASQPTHRDSPKVRNRARAKYQRISAQLASLNLISTGLENEKYAQTRQKYRDGLDILSQQRSNVTVPPRLRRLLTDSDAGTSSHEPLRTASADAIHEKDIDGRPALPYPLRRLLTGAETIEQQSLPFQIPAPLSVNPGLTRYGLPEPRYHREFEQLGQLGRGGYGVVYHVRHRLDNQFYAIKKVPLSTARLLRIQQQGSSELNAVLRELRTLARLDHPNIVRYHTGWIEWVDDRPRPESAHPGRSPRPLSGDTDDTVGGAADPSGGGNFQRIMTESDYDPQIVFEDSERTRTTTSAVTSTVRSSPDAFASPIGRFDTSSNTDPEPSSDRQFYQSQNSSASRTTGTIESIARMDGTSSSNILLEEDKATFKEPVLALHMQMSLHPMSLAEYLSSSIDHPSSSHAPPLSHCYHLGPSISILRAVLDGVEYLHNAGIAHRDIKPGNIFIGKKANSGHTDGSVDLMLCGDCRVENKAALISLEVRIGDFGLVSYANDDVLGQTKSEVVGTQIYRPAQSGVSDKSLDIYAIGIVAFELLWKFNTRMERLHTLLLLKQGQFPPQFATRLGHNGKLISECIKAMLRYNGDGVSFVEIRKTLSLVQ